MHLLQYIQIAFLRLFIQVKKVYYRLKARKIYQQIAQLKKEVKADNRKAQIDQEKQNNG
jgi:hypothetical protein